MIVSDSMNYSHIQAKTVVIHGEDQKYESELTQRTHTRLEPERDDGKNVHVLWRKRLGEATENSAGRPSREHREKTLRFRDEVPSDCRKRPVALGIQSAHGACHVDIGDAHGAFRKTHRPLRLGWNTLIVAGVNLAPENRRPAARKNATRDKWVPLLLFRQYFRTGVPARWSSPRHEN